jgi:hypothetical protein
MADGETHHAITRAWERWKIQITPPEWRDLKRRLKTAPLISVLPDGLQRRLINLKGRDVIALYAPDQGHIVTFVDLKGKSPDCALKHRRKQKPGNQPDKVRGGSRRRRSPRPRADVSAEDDYFYP